MNKKDLVEYLRKIGRKGGITRAKRHSKKEMSKWAMLGGRPKGSKNKSK